MALIQVFSYPDICTLLFNFILKCIFSREFLSILSRPVAQLNIVLVAWDFTLHYAYQMLLSKLEENSLNVHQKRICLTHFHINTKQSFHFFFSCQIRQVYLKMKFNKVLFLKVCRCFVACAK